MLIGLYGCGGCGRGLMPIARKQFGGGNCVWIDDRGEASNINGTPVLSFEQFLERGNGSEMQVCVTIADSQVRSRLVEKCQTAGFGFASLLADNAVLMDEVQLGPGAAISPFVSITSNIRIGRHFHANLYSYVEHDCVIGDFVTFAPGVKCNGNVHIADHAYIGSGAVIRHGLPEKPLRIGEGAVVGMGAVVTRDIPAGETWVGNPARPLPRPSVRDTAG